MWLAIHDGQMRESRSWRTKALRVTTFPQQLVKHAGGKKHRRRICTVIKQGDGYETHTLTGSSAPWEAVRLLWKSWQMYILTLRRLQKWNSSFSAACRLMDSSESGNSHCCWMGPAHLFRLRWVHARVCARARSARVRGRANACVCAFVRLACRVSLGHTWTASCLCSHASFASGRETARGWGGKGEGLTWGLLTVAVSLGTRRVAASSLLM